MGRCDNVYTFPISVKISEPGHPDHLHTRFVEIYQPVILRAQGKPKTFGYHARISPKTDNGIVYWGLLSTEDDAIRKYKKACQTYTEKIRLNELSPESKPPKNPLFHPRKGHPSIEAAVAALSVHAQKQGMSLLKPY